MSLRISVQSDRPSSSESSPSPSPVSLTSDASENIILHSVLCLYDFESNDPVHLPFHKNEILDVVQVEDSGWAAAMRQGGDVIGWIPQAFVRPLSEEMTERLRNVREELRVYEYEAEQLYNSAPIALSVPLYDEPSPPPSSGWIPEPAIEPRRRIYPPSPATPVPQPPSVSAPVNKPAPPTPTGPQISFQPLRYRSDSAPSLRNNNRGHGTRLAILSEYRRDSSPGARSSLEKRRGDKITRLTGSEDARAFVDAIQAQAQANQPWFIQPQYADQLQLDAEGQVRTGTITALMEKLTTDTFAKDPIKVAQDIMFRNVFLTTFRTFITPDEFFDKLVDIYRMEYPSDLKDEEFAEWKEKALLPTQRLILTIFTMWLEDHRLLEEEPHIAQRLSDFLSLVTTPPALALTARHIMQSIERLTFANPSTVLKSYVPVRKRRKPRSHKGDFLRLDSADIAEQLALMEFKLYAKITHQECIRYAKCQTGKAVANLNGFCATHDKLVAWVQTTILFNEALGKRADTVDHWIKVADKCRNLNNFASMSAIVNALHSVVLTRLHLTWAHVGRKSNLEALSKLNDPSGGFSSYRNLHSSADGPCVPFIGMYLTDIVHIQDQFSNEDDRISFVQCQRWYDAVTAMLKSQSRPYPIAENESTASFIAGHLGSMGTSSKDQARLWLEVKKFSNRNLLVLILEED